MKILDPISGETIDTDTWDQTNLTILPNLRVVDDTTVTRSSGCVFADLGVLRPEYDNEAGRSVPTIHVGDPGDEIPNNQTD